MKINLCFITDDYYAMPTCVTISSILKSKKQSTICNVYILCKDVSENKKNKFLELDSESLFIKIIDMNGKEDFSKYKKEGIPATPTAMYKFFIPEILKDLDKVLYLDGDIIVQKDLEELYNCDIGSNYIGAVKDTNGLDYHSLRNSNYKYFNSGVMVMNLKKMRQDDMPQKLLEYRKNGYNKLMDQDTFNFVLKGNVLLLPFEYNTQMNTLSSELQGLKNYNVTNFKKYWKISNEISNIREIYEEATILHYTTAKPWKFYDGYGNDLWLKNYINSPYGDENLYRESYYISRIINSSTYKIGKRMTYVYKFIKKLIYNQQSKKYKKFLTNFLSQ